MSNVDTATQETQSGLTLPEVSVVPIELRTVSPSQLKEADPVNGCLRQWFFTKVGKVKTKDKDWLNEGTAIHAAIEKYLKTGELPKEPAKGEEDVEHYHKVVAAKEFLPTPGDDLLLEFPKKLPTYEGGPLFSMKVDLVNPRDPNVLDIWDHKSTSDIHNKKGFLLTEETLLTDPQMMGYAHWGYDRASHDVVTVRHFYISSTHKGKCNPPVVATVSRELEAHMWNETLVQIRTMQSLATNPPPWQEVAPRKKASTCSKYGGCPYLSLCSSVDPWIGVSMNSGGADASDFLSQLRAMAEKGVTGEIATEEPPVKEAVVVEEPVVEAADLLAQIKGEAAKLTPQVVAGDGFGGSFTAGVYTTVPLLPPDAPSRMTPQPETEEKKTTTKAKGKKATTTAQFEYDIDRNTDHATVEYLNNRGSEGWRLVGFDGAGYVFIRERAL